MLMVRCVVGSTSISGLASKTHINHPDYDYICLFAPETYAAPERDKLWKSDHL